MAQGQYKNGVQINLVYQAAGLLSNAIPVGTVYDEGSAVHSAQTTALTSSLLAGELADPADGCYLGHFTPDAEGMWTVVIKDKNGAGEVTKMYDVAGHDLDSVGDAVAALDTADMASQLLLTKSSLVSAVLDDLDGLISDVESAVNVTISAVAALDTADMASQLLLTKSSLVSAVLDDMEGLGAASIASQLLITQSTLSGYISDVESAVDLIASPASVS